MAAKDNAPSPLAVIAEAHGEKKRGLFKMTKLEHQEICRLKERGKSNKEIAKVLHRATRTITEFFRKRGPTGAYAEMVLKSSLGDLSERFVQECNASEAMEALNRSEVKGYMKREKAVINTAVITIAQADVPSQEVIDEEEARLEDVRTGVVKEPVLAIPGVVEVDVPE